MLTEGSSEMNASISGIHVRSAGLHRRTCKFNRPTPGERLPEIKVSAHDFRDRWADLRNPLAEIRVERIQVAHAP